MASPNSSPEADGSKKAQSMVLTSVALDDKRSPRKGLRKKKKDRESRKAKGRSALSASASDLRHHSSHHHHHHHRSTSPTNTANSNSNHAQQQQQQEVQTEAGGSSGHGSAEETSPGGSPEVRKKHRKAKKEHKKEHRKEKKDRKHERKELKRNPTFDFIEGDEPVPSNKKEKKKIKKETKQTFDFTKDNKELEGSHINRRVLKQLKHGSSKDRSGDLNAAQSNKRAASEVSTKTLEEFLLTHTLHRLRGTTWQYLYVLPDAAQLKDDRIEPTSDFPSPTKLLTDVSRETMVVLVGGGSRPEAFYEQLETLAEDFNVIAPVVPKEFNQFDDYVAGINLILNHFALQRIHMYGIAFGGMIAQYYAYSCGERVSSLVLSHTPPPTLEFGKLCQKHADKKLKGDPPSAIQRSLMGWNLKSKEIVRDMPDNMLTENGLLDFWKRVTKRFESSPPEILSRIEAMAAHHLSATYDDTTFAKLKCPVLLMDSERTEEFGRQALESQQRLFPKADTHIFSGYGHLVVMMRGKHVGRVILDWLHEKTFNLDAEAGMGEKGKAEASSPDNKSAAKTSAPADKENSTAAESSKDVAAKPNEGE